MFSHCKSMGASDPRDGAIFDPRVMVSRNFKEDYYILLHTKYESSGPCGFGEEDFFFFPHCKSMGAINDPWSGATFDPRGMVGWLPTFTILVTCVIKYHLHNF